MKYLLLGIITFSGVCIVSVFTNDWSYVYKISGIIGVVCLVICGLAVGAFTTSAGSRPLHHSQFEKDSSNRVKWTTRFLLFGAPHIIAAGIYIYVLLM